MKMNNLSSKRYLKVFYILLYILIFQFILLQNVFASRMTPALWRAWKKSDLVIIGKAEEAETIGRHIAIYEIIAPKIIKGEKPENDIFVVDFHYLTSASIPMISGSKHMLFLLENSEDGFDEEKGIERRKYFHNGKLTYRSILECKFNIKTKRKLFKAINKIEQYFSLSDKKQKKDFLLSNLKTSNPYLKNLIEYELIMLKVDEAVPYYKKLLNRGSEDERLRAASELRCIQSPYVDPYLGEILVKWLKDPHFKSKTDVINEIRRLKYKEAIPTLREFINDKDELIAVNAMICLFHFKEQDAKSLLFKLLQESNDSTARYNAIHTLHWGYNGEFTIEEIVILKELSKDDDDSIKRVSEFILEGIDNSK